MEKTVQWLEDEIIFWSKYCREDKVFEALTLFAEANADKINAE